MQKNDYRKINDFKERLRIVLASLQPGVNKSELCRKEGIYLQQLIRWTQEALQGAEGALKRKPIKPKNDVSRWSTRPSNIYLLKL